MEERIFSWSLDGFGSTLFRFMEDGRERFVNRYSAMEAGENDREVPKESGVEYGSFEEFWGAFTGLPYWLRYRPEFVHKDYKRYLQQFFSNFPQGSMTMCEHFRFILWLHKIED